MCEKVRFAMKLRTRLLITSLTIIILPLALTFIAFFCIGTVILRSNQNDFHIQTIDYSLMSDTVQSLCDITEEVFLNLNETADNDPALLEEIKYLQQIDLSLEYKSSSLIDRKEEEIYFSGNQYAAEKDRKSVV